MTLSEQITAVAETIGQPEPAAADALREIAAHVHYIERRLDDIVADAQDAARLADAAINVVKLRARG